MEDYKTIDYLLNPYNPEIRSSALQGSLDFLTIDSREPRAELKRRLYRRIKYLEAKLNLAKDPVVVLMKKRLDILETLTKKTRSNGVKPYWIWMTVRPKDGSDFSNFQCLVKQLVMRKHVAEYLYVYEQVGESFSDLGNGFHFHLLLLTTPDRPKPSELAKNFKNTFKQICNIKTGACHIITKCPDKFVRDKVDYMLGNKTGIGKDIKQVADRLWRKSNNLKNFYSSPEFLSKYKV